MKHASRVNSILARRNRGLVLMGMCSLAVPVVSANALPTDGQIDWAKEQKFWSFQRPKPHPHPTVINVRWPRQPLDYFILSRLEKLKLVSSHEADRRTLIRRLTFDLTGLPPTPEESQALNLDKQPGAYERVVNRLLASPRF